MIPAVRKIEFVVLTIVLSTKLRFVLKEQPSELGGENKHIDNKKLNTYKLEL